MSDSESQDPITLQGETVAYFPSKEKASVAACEWTRVTNPNELELYKGRIGPGKDKVVGVGIRRPSGIIEDIVRVDMDNLPPSAPNGKGIHFNAKDKDNSRKTYAAVITPTTKLTLVARRRQYDRILAKIQDQTARVIWFWWSTGSGLFAEEDEGENEVEGGDEDKNADDSE